MRRRRLDIRIALLLAVMLFLAPAVLAASWHVFLRPDPRRLVASGDASLAAGRWRDADRDYSAALRLRGDDAGIVRKLADVLERAPAQDIAEADRTVGRLLGVYGRWRELAPGDEEPLRRMFVLYERLGRECGRVSAWDAILRESEAVLRSHPRSQIARKYRSIAQTQRMRSLDPPESERHAAHDDLLAALQASPDDPDLPLAVATWRIVESHLLDRPGGSADASRRWRDTANEFTRKAALGSPGNAARIADELSVLLEVGDRRAAVEWADRLEKAVGASPCAPSVAMTLAEARLRLDVTDEASSLRVARAAAVLHGVAARAPGDPRVSFILAQCEVRMNRTDAAIQRFESIASATPSVPTESVLMLAKASLTPSARRRAMDLRSARTRAVAAEAWLDGRSADAVAALAEVWRLSPGPISLAEYASALIASNHEARARSLLAEQTSLTRENPALLSLLAEACRRAGDANEARTHWHAALTVSRSLPQFSSVVAQLRRSAGLAEAQSMLGRLTNDTRINPWWRELASIEMAVHAGDFDGAINRLDAIGGRVSVAGDEALAIGRLRGLAYQRAGRFVESERAYRAVLAVSTDDRVAANNLAFMLAEDMNRPADALPLAARLAERWRDDARVLDTYGWVLFRGGRRGDAAAVLGRSVALLPTAESLWHYALALESLGKNDESVRLLKAAKEAARRESDTALEQRVSDKLKDDSR